MLYQWRRFQFFEKELLAQDDEGKEPVGLFQEFRPTCSASGRGHLIFGDSKGAIKIANRDFDEQVFPAYEGEGGVIALHQLKRQHTMVSLGNELGNSSIKVWKLDKVDAEGLPICARALRIFSPKFPQKIVTCFSVLEDLSQIAVGLETGVVMLFDGNIYRDRGCKQTVIYEGAFPITGLHFHEPAERGEASLFVVTVSQVVTIYTKRPKYEQLVIDENGGAGPGCSVVNEAGSLVCARNEGVFFYEPQEQGKCFGLQGLKKGMGWFNNYLYIIGDDAPTSKKSVLTIYDLTNKFIAFTTKLDTVINVVPEWSSLFILVSVPASKKTDKEDKIEMWQLSEKDLPAKMEMLFKKNLYSIAISLAQEHHRDDPAYVMDIFQRFGDHLYDKGDYDAAMQQYLETISYVEPSYVIRKFLDAQRIHNLTRYLQALHDKGRASVEHTTLLLNCYTKLKDVQMLDEFIQKNNTFSVENAITVLRQAGYFKHALYLAYNQKNHKLYLKVQLEDTNNAKDALAYINSLPHDLAERYAKRYGKTLIHELPEETTKLFISLCTGYVSVPFEPPTMIGIKPSTNASNNNTNTLNVNQQRRGSNSGISSSSGTVQQGGRRGSSSGLSGNTSQSNGNLAPLVRSGSTCGSCSSSSSMNSGSRFSFSSRSFTKESEGKSLTPRMGSVESKGAGSLEKLGFGDNSETKYNPVVAKSNAEDFIHFFIGKRPLLKQFLEEISARIPPTTMIQNTLLEIYLRQEFDPNDPDLKQQMQAKVMNLLKSQNACYDVDRALTLCKAYDFEKAVLFLYAKLNPPMFREIVQHHMDRGKYSDVIETCKRHGDQDPGLWVQALSYFANKEEACDEEIIDVLNHIETRNLLPPLRVVQILSQNPHKPLSVVKDYIIRVLENEKAVIQADQREIRRYQEETATMKQQAHLLKTRATTFQGLKCHACTNAISLPAVHFLCMHSFHQRCVVDNDRECPKCAPEFQNVRTMKMTMRASASQHDKFFKKLDDSKDGFATVAEYFGRGIFDKGADLEEK